jgi:hypothetical protein
MKRIAIAGVAAILLAGGGIAADDEEREFKAALTGAEEVPPVVTNTTGDVEIEFNQDLTKAEFELTVRQGMRVQQAHIHCAQKGVNGQVVVFLAGFHDRGWDVDGSWIENTTVTDANVIARAPTPACPFAITTLADVARAAREGYAYVNVHTVANPGGEIRGQLSGDDGQ